jgi:hypothetical protein
MAKHFHYRYVRLTATMTRAEREALVTGLPALARAFRAELSEQGVVRPSRRLQSGT